MKQLFTLLAFAVFSLSSLTAQITILSDDIDPIGVVADQTADMAPDASIVPGADGQQTWDFSALQMGDVLTYTFVTPGLTPYADLFPEANLASEQGGNYFYFGIDADELTAHGTYGDFLYGGFTVTAEAHIEPPQSLLQFPTNFQDSYDETVVQTAQGPGSAIGLPFDSVRIERTVDRSVNIDAYGSITTPLGTFEALRSTEVEVVVDKLSGQSFGNWQVISESDPVESTLYNWWTNEGNFGFPVVQIQTDAAGTVTGANWLTDFISGAEEAFDLEFALYPNPAPNSLTVEVPEFFTGTLEVVDLNGKKALHQNISGQLENLPTSSLNIGTYVLVVRQLDGTLAAAKRFQVQR